MKDKVYLVLVTGVRINEVFKKARRIRESDNSWYYYFKKESSAIAFIKKLEKFCQTEYNKSFTGDYFVSGGAYQHIADQALAKDKKYNEVKAIRTQKLLELEMATMHDYD